MRRSAASRRARAMVVAGWVTQVQRDRRRSENFSQTVGASAFANAFSVNIVPRTGRHARTHEQAAEPCRRGVYNHSLPPADNIISWPTDKFRGIQARMLDRFHISGRSGDLAGAQRGNESSNGVDDDANVPGGECAGNVGGCGNRAGALGSGRRRGGDDGGSGGGDGVRACGIQFDMSSLEQAAEPCRRGVYNLSLPPADNIISRPADKFRGIQARMTCRNASTSRDAATSRARSAAAGAATATTTTRTCRAGDAPATRAVVAAEPVLN